MFAAAGGKPITRRVRIYGSAGAVSPNLDAALQCVIRNKSKPKDFLGSALTAIALAAAGEPVGAQFRAIVVGIPPDNSDKKNPAPPWVRAITPPSRDKAREYLTRLVAEMLSEGNDYFLPIEAVAAVIEEMKKEDGKRDIARAIDEVRENRGLSCSSDFGPVRNARDFEPPPEETIAELIQRRYGPLAAIFGEQE
jgi:hypothetical protein